MSKKKIEVGSDFEPTPTIMLTEKVGSSVKGRLYKKVESSMFAGNYSYLIDVKDTDAPTKVYNDATGKMEECDITTGSRVWVKGTTMLNKALLQVEDGTTIEIKYLGKGEAQKGRKAPYLFDVYLLDGEDA